MSDAVLNQFTPQSHEEDTVDVTRRLRFGIIGTGWIAESHIESLKKMPDVDIVAGADLIPGKAEKFFKRYEVPGVHCYPDHKSMLENEKLDAVCVCTYNMTHAECTIDALDAGVNVLLEKPMTVTTEEAVEIIRAERRSGKLLSASWARSTTSRPAADAAAASPTAPLLRRRLLVSVRSAISAAMRWTWCSTPSAIRSR